MVSSLKHARTLDLVLISQLCGHTNFRFRKAIRGPEIRRDGDLGAGP